MTRCPRCAAGLSDWETRYAEYWSTAPCWCEGVPPQIQKTLANVAYAELCHPNLTQPVKTHDVIRFITPHYNGNAASSINVALSQDKRFCWSGRGLYGLARHGMIPGVRSLAEAAYVILIVAPRQLHLEEVDFVLKQLNYRFSEDSLFFHLRGYGSNRWGFRFHMDSWNRVSVASGREIRNDFNNKIHVCPTHKAFNTWLDEILCKKVEHALMDRVQRLENIGG
jgi:hypothetical protein